MVKSGHPSLIKGVLMSAIFPSLEWLQGLQEKLNSDEKYAQVAKKWEGDMLCVLDPDDRLPEQALLYIDLWHGKCRDVAVWDEMPSLVSKPFPNNRPNTS